METTNFINSLGSSDLHSFILCLEAYNNLSQGDKEKILEVGVNLYSGFIYLFLESGLSICSRFGRPVIYIITNESGEELEFETHFEACEFIQFGHEQK